MNIYGAFFIFDEGNIVMLFNGFQKKTQKTPESEIEKAVKLKNEYYASKPGRWTYGCCIRQIVRQGRYQQVLYLSLIHI